MKYFVEVVHEDGAAPPVACKSLSSAGTKALNLLHRNKHLEGFVCVRVADEDGNEWGRLIYKPEN